MQNTADLTGCIHTLKTQTRTWRSHLVEEFFQLIIEHDLVNLETRGFKFMTKTWRIHPLTPSMYQTQCQVQIGADNIRDLPAKKIGWELNDPTQIQRQ